MRKLSFRRIVTLALATFVIVAAISVCDGGVYANEEYTFAMERIMFMPKNSEPAVYITRKGLQDDLLPISVKSSNPKVIKVVKDYDGLFILKTKKLGKALITATFIDVDGNKRTVSRKFYSKKYPNFIKSLRICGKKMNVKEDMGISEIKTKKTKASIKFVLKNGWKESSAFGVYYKKNGRMVMMPQEELDKILKGKTFKFPKKYKNMHVSIRLEKGEAFMDYSIDLKRK